MNAEGRPEMKLFFVFVAFFPGYILSQECGLSADLGVEDKGISNDAMWASSVSTPQRAAHFGRLGDSSGGNGWTAAVSNTKQLLGVDLGGRKVITDVSTQGRRGSAEWVIEFLLEFSEDNSTWIVYLDEYGVPYRFLGNVDDFGIVRNTLSRPIVARYIRFKPMRWQSQISMRIEVYGCDYHTTTASYDGSSYLQYRFDGGLPIDSLSDKIKFRLKTWRADGILMYAKGSQGDYVAIEMLRGQLYYKYSLGSTPTDPGDNTARAGSLLDDNQWHDVEILRDRKLITFIIDRVTYRDKSDGDFERLNIDTEITIGGASRANQIGLEGKFFFQGCIENFEFNYERMIRNAKNRHSGYEMVGAVKYECQAPQLIPATIPTYDSYIKLAGTQTNILRVKLDFRSYDHTGLLFFNRVNTNGHIKLSIDQFARISVELFVPNQDIIRFAVENNEPSSAGKFTDGLWHTAYLHIRPGQINCTVDRVQPFVTEVNNKYELQTTQEYFIGGKGKAADEVGTIVGTIDTGFVGCVKNVEIDGAPMDLSQPLENVGVLVGTCGILDRCHPTPCLHKGLCEQTWKSFTCNCDDTGYTGSTCTVSKYPLSCQDQRIKLQQRKDELSSGIYMIDMDGSGPLDSVQVTCHFPKDQSQPARTQLFHNRPDKVTVRGYQLPGSFVEVLNYKADREQLSLLVSRSESCYQEVSYGCRLAHFLATPEDDLVNQPGTSFRQKTWSWWVGRTHQPQYFWGGAVPPSFGEVGKCACGVQSSCERGVARCNCDAYVDKENVDSGKLTQQDLLPVMEMHVGDTGTTVTNTDDRYVKFKIGELNCHGDKLFDTSVTFRKTDATIEYPRFFDELDKRVEKSEDRSSSTIDVYLQFKTTRRNGIILQAMGTDSGHFLEIRLFDYNIMQFRFNVGNGIKTLERVATEVLNNDEWHTVHVERNRKQAVLLIDDQPPVVQDEPLDLGYRPLRLTSPLVIGAGVDYRNGFVGCMRSLVVNGNVLDLKAKVTNGEFTYGLSPNCVGKCASAPCLNTGVCRELYDEYSCDCTYTVYRGWICGREVGVNMKSGWYIRYDFEGQKVTTVDETMIVGFTTEQRGGILMQIVGEKNNHTEFISIEVTNNGGLRVSFDVGFGFGTLSIPLDIPDVDLVNGQQHIANVTRFDNGKKWLIQVDQYPPRVFLDTDNSYLPVGGLPDGADVKLDNVKYIYMGANKTVIDNNQESWMFQGCLYHVRFNEKYPLKEAFFDPRPSYVMLFPNDTAKFREDMCGYEEILHPPEPAEIRPTPPQPIPSLGPSTASSNTKKLILGVCLAVAFVALVIVAFFVGRWVSRNRGDYATDEAKGADDAADADRAVANADTGQPAVAKKKEFFL